MDFITLIVKPASTSCNLACDYCYHGKNRKPEKIRTMDDELLEKLVTDFAQLGQKKSKFLWHGGEPTLAGLKFFEKAMSLQQIHFSNSQLVINSIQTNGIIIDASWANYFKENKFHVGISLDGDKYIHDQHRRDFAGNGSFDRVMVSIEIMVAIGIRVGIVCTVTKTAVNKAKDMLSFFTENGIMKLNFSPSADYDTNGTLMSHSISSEEWGNFLVQLFDAWVAMDNTRAEIQLIDNILRSAFGAKSNLCVLNRNCGEFLSVGSDGSVYICGRFLGNQHFLVGDLRDQSFKQILQSSRYQNVVNKTVELPQKCINCEWQQLCNGGCAYYRFMDGDNRNDPYFCEAMKIAIAHIKKSLLNFGVQEQTIWPKTKS